jgi:hypothetical protein
MFIHNMIQFFPLNTNNIIKTIKIISKLIEFNITLMIKIDKFIIFL